MSPVTAHLSLGLEPERIGQAAGRLIELTWAEPVCMPRKIEGQVTSVDSFGNLITNISADQLADVPRSSDSVRISCGPHETFGIFETYSDQPEMTLMALVGSDGFLELAIVGDSAKIMLGEGVDTAVTVSW